MLGCLFVSVFEKINNQGNEWRLPSWSEIRMPPHSAEAEQAILGGLMLDNTGWGSIVIWSRQMIFYRLGHKLIFKAITRLADEGRALDAITVSEVLENAGGFEKAVAWPI